MIRVLFFGPVAESVGARELQLPYRPGLGVREARDVLATSHPEAFALVSIVAVDGERVRDDEDVALADGAELVFMSRFSGG